MLESKCCKNYLCLLCALEIQDKETKDNSYRASCPYKCSTPGSGATDGDKFELQDVADDAKIKRYSDS